MSPLNPNGNSRLTKKAFTEGRARRPAHELFQEGHRIGEKRPLELMQVSKSVTNKANRLDWQMVALWIFVAVSFAAFVFAGYLLWAKCRGTSPF